MRSLSVRGIRIDRLVNTPAVILREEDNSRRQFEIYIGAPEAASIKTALDGESTPRPLTHDLFVLALERLNVTVSRVVITQVKEGTYYADIVLVPESGDEVIVSARPSDAIAIALRASCPIFATDELVDQVGEVPSEDEPTTASEILDEFRDFIENISPEDFDK